MEFFGVGPAELVFVLILALLVLGPERLPEVGRFLGRLVARIMAWQQQSPEYQMLQQIRQEMEQEIGGIRHELDRAKQYYEVNARTVQQELRAIQRGAQPALNPPRGGQSPVPTSPPNRTANGATTAKNPTNTATATASTTNAPPGSTTTDSNTNTDTDTAPSPAPTQPAVPAPAPAQETAILAALQDISGDVQTLKTDVQMLQTQMQSLMTDVHALQHHLREQGHLSDDWSPPSHATAITDTTSTARPTHQTRTQTDDDEHQHQHDAAPVLAE